MTKIYSGHEHAQRKTSGCQYTKILNLPLKIGIQRHAEATCIALIDSLQSSLQPIINPQHTIPVISELALCPDSQWPR